jgi:hypothetical protein
VSTRGFISFAIDGETKTAYNHSDSYPSWLGIQVLSFLEVNADGILNDRDDETGVVQLARKLRVVDGDAEPTDADIEQHAAYANLNVGGRSERPTWYQLLRETQGCPTSMLKAGVIEDASEFPADSLFAEYGYVVDLDANVFEVYEGFQAQPHKSGRFAHMQGRDGYVPVKLVKSWPIESLPSKDEFLRALGDDE